MKFILIKDTYINPDNILYFEKSGDQSIFISFISMTAMNFYFDSETERDKAFSKLISIQ